MARQWARAILRLLHPTAAPYTSDVTKVAYALKQFDSEMREARRMSNKKDDR